MSLQLFLGVLSDETTSSWTSSLDTLRDEFELLKKRYVDDLQAHLKAERDLALNNPLSQDDTSPWKRFFEDSQLQKTIAQDVERTFPDNDFFRSDQVQGDMTAILFIYCRENASVSYRQGMHELLALILWVVYSDALESAADAADPTDKLIAHVLDPQFTQHDTYALFVKLLDTMRPWFDSGPNLDTPQGDQQQQYEEQLLFKSSSKALQQQAAAKAAPVMQKCHRVQHVLLAQYDPQLYAHLSQLGIEPQLYGMYAEKKNFFWRDFNAEK